MSSIVIGKDVQQAYDSIVSGDKSLSWAVFSYEGQTELKLQTSGAQDLSEFADEFSDGKLQYAFMRVDEPNSKLPKMVLIGWCGEGAPRKGVFQQHFSSVAKQLSGYHVQITARSEEDLTEDKIMKKVEDASGAKYSMSSSASVFGPTSSKKPPTTNSLVNQLKGQGSPAFNSRKPTLTEPRLPSSTTIKPAGSVRDQTPTKQSDDWDTPKTNEHGRVEPREPITSTPSESTNQPVKSAYQPIGRPDINALRAQAQTENPSLSQPARGTSYKPIEVPKTGSLADRMSAFQNTTKPAPTTEPKRGVSNPLAARFGSGIAGTKPIVPTATARESQAISGLGKNFGSEGGKTPSQLWAERKARERGQSIPESIKEAPVKATSYDQGDADEPTNVSSIKDRFAQMTTNEDNSHDQPTIVPMPRQPVVKPKEDSDSEVGDSQAVEEQESDAPSEPTQTRPPPPNMSTRPGASLQTTSSISQRSPSPAKSLVEEEPEDDQSSKPAKNDFKAQLAQSLAGGAGTATAATTGTPATTKSTTKPASSKPQAKAVYEYEAQEENELSFAEGDRISEIDMVDEGWWSGECHGKSGLFPSNYVELIDGEDEGEEETGEEETAEEKPQQQAPTAQSSTGKGQCATAVYEYEAGEEGEIGFAEGEMIEEIDQIDEGWWKGKNAQGEEGLFPSNYVELI